MYQNVWKCIKMSENVSKCLKMYQNVWKCIRMYENTYVLKTFWTPKFYFSFAQALKMYANVSKCLKMYENVSKCLQMYENVSKWKYTCMNKFGTVYSWLTPCPPVHEANNWRDCVFATEKRRDHWRDGFLPQYINTFLIRSFALKAPSDSEGRRACYHNYHKFSYSTAYHNNNCTFVAFKSSSERSALLPRERSRERVRRPSGPIFEPCRLSSVVHVDLLLSKMGGPQVFLYII